MYLITVSAVSHSRILEGCENRKPEFFSRHKYVTEANKV
jgi:hypothetical protein